MKHIVNFRIQLFQTVFLSHSENVYVCCYYIVKAYFFLSFIYIYMYIFLFDLVCGFHQTQQFPSTYPPPTYLIDCITTGQSKCDVSH